MKKRSTKIVLLFMLCFMVSSIGAQQVYSVKECIGQALKNNHNLKKSKFDREKSFEARREIIGSLLPQINASANFSDNIKNMSFIMPNFVNNFLPPAMQDPNAAKYMSITMGTPYSASTGVVLSQQLLNFSLFNAIEISKMAEKMSELGIESKEEDIISQTTGLYYSIQITEYTLTQFEKSIGLMDSMLKNMEISLDNGILRKVDVDRLKVSVANLQTQKGSIKNALDVQKNLLKLQIGLPMNVDFDVDAVDLQNWEEQSAKNLNGQFDINIQTPYKLIQQQQDMSMRQKKAAIYESLPVLTLSANYQMNWASDRYDFSKQGDVSFRFPTSVIALNLKIPVFSGLSRSAKLKEATLEQKKINEDAASLEQALEMAYLNASSKIEDCRKIIKTQKENMITAQYVYDISESNYKQGIASMSDVLNANSSLIQSQLSYADALNGFMKAYIELKKADGTIRDFAE